MARKRSRKRSDAREERQQAQEAPGVLLSPKHRHLVILGVILLVAAALRFWGFDFGLPYQLHPDEPVHYLAAKWLAIPGGIENWSPESTMYKIVRSYPPLYHRFLLMQQKILEAFEGGKAPQPHYFLLARATNILLALGAIVVAFLLASFLADHATGLLTAAFLAVNPQFVQHSRYAVPDMPVTLLFVLAVYLALLSLDRRQKRIGYFGFGCALLAFANKYNALPVLAVPVYAILRNSWPDRRRLLKDAGLLILILAGTFLILYSRFNILDIFYAPMSSTASILEKSSIFSFPGAKPAGLALLSASGGIVTPGIILLGFLLLAVAKQPSHELDWEKIGLILAIMVVFFLTLSLWNFGGEIRHFLPLILLIAVLWAIGLRSIAKFLTDRGNLPAGWTIAGTSLAAVLLLAWPAVQTGREASRLTLQDTRALTAEWLLEHAPDGSVVAVEYDAVELLSEYGGFPGPKRFQPLVLNSLFEVSLQEYHRIGVSYLVADIRAKEGGGFFSDPDNSDFLNGVTVVQSFSGQEYQGPDRIIFELKGSAQAYLAEGQAYLNEKDFDRAEEVYTKALELNPDIIQAHSALGYIYALQGKLQEAVEENLEVVKLAPDDYVSHRNLALLYKQMGRIDDAVAEAQIALRLAPEKDKAALETLITQLKQGQPITGSDAE
jgi:tetratricopeptide (TPR) repeat protein